MRSETSKTIDKKSYPSLVEGLETGVIILALKQKTESTIEGIVVGGTAYPIGHYSDGWNLHFFKDFGGSVTLSNY